MSVLLLETEWYAKMFDYMPQHLVYARYAFSWAQRVVGIGCAVGLLYYKEIFRKITLFWGAFVLLTLYWKHPLARFMNAAEYAGRRIAEPLAAIRAYNPNITLESLVAVSVGVMYFLDITFWACVFYFLTRPHIKNQFD